MRRTKYIPSEHLLLASQELRDDYNYFVRNLVRITRKTDCQRHTLAEKYLQGATRGVELGGFHAPNHLPLGTQADYVDQASIDELKTRFPEINDLNCVFASIIDNGENLSTIPSEHYDFLIANHMIEHTEDFIKTIQNHLRVIKPEGYILYAVADKRFTFDADRKLTTYEHLEDEYINGSEKNRKSHYADFLENVSHLSGDELELQTKALLQAHQDTHFHVWDFSAFEEHIHKVIANSYISARVREIVSNGIEFICVLQKR